MYKIFKHLSMTLLLVGLYVPVSFCQTIYLSDAISIARNSSVQTLESRQSFISTYWAYRSCKASRLPSFNLYGGLMNFDRSLTLMQSYEDSSFQYVNSYNLQNSLGLHVSQNLTFTGSTLSVYSDLLDQEVVGLSFSVPIFDWGLGKGKVQKAKAAQEVVRAQVQQSENDFRRQIFTAVGQFNNQRHQCSVSKRAMLIAQERYELMMEKFRSGKASVMELNTAQSENDTALQKYITDVSNFWEYYYTLRQYTLYDFIKGQDLDIDVNEIIY